MADETQPSNWPIGAGNQALQTATLTSAHTRRTRDPRLEYVECTSVNTNHPPELASTTLHVEAVAYCVYIRVDMHMPSMRQTPNKTAGTHRYALQATCVSLNYKQHYKQSAAYPIFQLSTTMWKLRQYSYQHTKHLQRTFRTAASH
eukprot:361413-Chlamydomonas_euryale.AAC.4